MIKKSWKNIIIMEVPYYMHCINSIMLPDHRAALNMPRLECYVSTMLRWISQTGA